MARYTSDNHERLFPFSDNLTTLMFTAASDFSEIQRERLTSTLSLRGMTVPAYTLHAVKTVFLDLFRTPKSLMKTLHFDQVNTAAVRPGPSSSKTILKTNMDSGPQMKQSVSKLTLMTKDCVFGHGTTPSMSGSADRSRVAS